MFCLRSVTTRSSLSSLSEISSSVAARFASPAAPAVFLGVNSFIRSADPTRDRWFDKCVCATIERHEPSGQQLVEHAVRKLEVMVLETGATGEERHGADAVERRQIREPAIRTDKTARAGDQARLDLEIAMWHRVGIDDVHPGRASRLQ